MQVRDLIEELKRHDPHKEVKVELREANAENKRTSDGRAFPIDDYEIDINPLSLAGPVILTIRHECHDRFIHGV